MAAARGIDVTFANKENACYSFGSSRLIATPRERSFGGFQLSPAPPTRLSEGSLRAKHALLAEVARSTQLSTDFRLRHTSTVVPRTSHLQRELTNYTIDSIDQNEGDPEEPGKKKQSEKVLRF